jgi:hypothetical protein
MSDEEANSHFWFGVWCLGVLLGIINAIFGPLTP